MIRQLYVGVGGGGVWKTTNAGTTWTPYAQSDTLPDAACAALATN